MVIELHNYLRTMPMVIRREDARDDMENVITSMSKEVIPALTNFIKQGKDVEKLINGNVFMENMRNISHIKSDDNLDFVKKIVSIFSDIVKHEKDILKLIDDSLSEVVSNKMTQAKDIAIIKLITDIGGMNYYVMDLIYYVLINDNETNLPASKEKELRANSVSFVSVLNFFNQGIKSVIKQIDSIAVIPINGKNVNPSMLETLLKNNGKIVVLPDTSSFNNNPIYHIRMYLKDKEMAKYEALKDKKQLIEFKLVDAKLEANKDNNPKLKEKIEFYEEKVASLEYDIKQIEDDDSSVFKNALPVW